MVKIKQDRHKGLVYGFWVGEYIIQCNISGVSFWAFFFTWVKPALFPFSWDCNSWNQNCIFHKCVILTCHIHSGYTRLLILLSSWYCYAESVLCYSLPWTSQGSKQIPGLHFLLLKRSWRKLHSSSAVISALSSLCFPSSAAWSQCGICYNGQWLFQIRQCTVGCTTL